MRIFIRFLSCIFLFLSFFLAGCTPGFSFGENGQGRQERLIIRMLDIGQGDAILLEKNGKFALIDSGDVEHRSHLMQEGGRNVMTLCLSAPEAEDNEKTVTEYIGEYPEALEKETCIVFAGNGAGNPNAMIEMLQEKLPDVEISLINAGQSSDCWMIGLG